MNKSAVHHDKNEALVAALSTTSSMKSKKVKSKASKESSMPRRQSDEFLSKKKKKKKQNSSSIKKSKSFAGKASAASSTPPPPFCVENMGLGPSMLARQPRSSLTAESIMALLPPKRSSTTNKAVRVFKASEESSSPFQTEHFYQKKRKDSSMKRSKSFAGQPSSASPDPTDSSAPRLSKGKRNGSGLTRSKSFSDQTGAKSMSKQKRNSSGTKMGIKRSKSFGDKTGAKSLSNPALTRRISKQKRGNKSRVNKENGSSVLERLNSTLTPVQIDTAVRRKKQEETVRAKNKNGERRVQFSDKIKFKIIKHSKVDPDSIWYSNEEIEALREREHEVKRQACSCNNSTLLNIEGLLTFSERNTMFERQIESREAVFEVQDSIRRHKELMETSSAIFQDGTFLDFDDLYDQDRAIADEYELFAAGAIQCAQQRATHLALHVNLLWDQNFEFAGKEGWHKIKLVTPSTQHRSPQMLIRAQ